MIIEEFSIKEAYGQNAWGKIENDFKKANYELEILSKKYEKERIPMLIKISKNVRGIGKTRTLYNLAKKFGGIILVHSNADSLNLTYRTDLFFNYKAFSIRGLPSSRYFIDEYVPFYELDESIKKFTVFGYINDEYEDNHKLINNIDNIDDINLIIVKSLKENVIQLNDKLAKTIKDDNIGTYKNTLIALGSTLKMIEEYENSDKYELKFSEYITTKNGKETKQVSVWEQNKNGNIRNHKVWDIYENEFKIKGNFISNGVVLDSWKSQF